AGAQEVDARHAAGLRSARSRGESGVQNVHVDRQERRSRADDLRGTFDDRVDPERAEVVHEEARDPALALPCELALARPVAAQPDLHTALGIADAGLDE